MIPFRTQRLATSVVNRIMNVADGVFPKSAPGMPAAPDTSIANAELAANANEPKGPVDASQQTAAEIALAPLVR
jgi:hypothetical protein